MHRMTPSPEAADDGPLFLDVRSRGEFESGHLDGARHLPLDRLQHDIGRIVPDPQRDLVVYCASGARSAFACAVLQQLGYRQARNGGGLGMLALSTQRPIRRA